MPNNTESLNLRRLLQILRRRFAVIALCAILVPAGALAFSLSQPKKYTATSSLLVRNPDLDRQLFGTVAPAVGTAQDPARDVATNLKLFKLGTVAERTARALGGRVTAGQGSSGVEVNSDSSSNVATI